MTTIRIETDSLSKVEVESDKLWGAQTSAIAYVREGYSNIRVGMFLEVATTFGAVTEALIAAKTPMENLFSA